jgi:hypothetical protein
LSRRFRKLAPAHEHTFGHGAELERIRAPDHHVGLSTRLQRAKLIGHTKQLRWRERRRAQAIGPRETVRDCVAGFLPNVTDVELLLVAAAGVSNDRHGDAGRVLALSTGQASIVVSAQGLQSSIIVFVGTEVHNLRSQQPNR